MVQLNSFHVVRYRGIDGLSLSQLSKANLITGANGAGKTALIEAMWLFTGRHKPGLLWDINLQRTNSSSANPLARLTDGDLELRGIENGVHHEIKFSFESIDGGPPTKRIAGTINEDLKRLAPTVGFIKSWLDGKLVTGGSEGIYVTPSGSVLHASPDVPDGRFGCVIETARFQHAIPSDYHARYSDLVREGRKKELIKAIGLVAPNVEDVEILTDEGREPYLSIAISGERPRPLYDLGGGAVRLARLLIGFFVSQGAVLLSDELENGLHHSAQREVWDKTRQWIEQWNVQLFATTHSAEFINAAIDAFSDCPEDLSIHRLYRNENTGKPEAVTFTGDALEGARGLDLEIR